MIFEHATLEADDESFLNTNFLSISPDRQEADSDERAMRVRPKGHAQDARGQLRPNVRVAKPRVHFLTPTGFFLFRSTLYSIPRSATVLVVGPNCGSFVAGQIATLAPVCRLG